MTIADDLDILRAQFPNCDVAVFADLSTGMVLAATSTTKVTQERLDTLCEAAVDALRGSTAQNLSSHLLVREEDLISQAVRLSASGFEVFLTSNACSDDVLCLVCSRGVDLPALTQGALTLLHKFEAEN